MRKVKSAQKIEGGGGGAALGLCAADNTSTAGIQEENIYFLFFDGWKLEKGRAKQRDTNHKQTSKGRSIRNLEMQVAEECGMVSQVKD